MIEDIKMGFIQKNYIKKKVSILPKTMIENPITKTRFKTFPTA